jgi:hypothetical protein
LEKPVFAPMKDGLEFCVLIRWKTGAQSRVSHFACARDAQRWIDHESENWFRSRIEARARQRSVAGEDLRDPWLSAFTKRVANEDKPEVAQPTR